MARYARVVVAGYPYHITHRGNRREAVFFTDEDRAVYLSLLHEYAGRYGLKLWAYCLMTNHVHLIAVPEKSDSMANAMGRAHMRYARWINRQRGWTGHLWANRYFSTVLDGSHVWDAARYVEANPLRAGMVAAAEDYRWSSCRSHAGLEADAIAGLLDSARPFPGYVGATNWPKWINAGVTPSMAQTIRLNTTTGRPTGEPEFVDKLERELDRILRRQKVGRKPSGSEQANDSDDLFKMAEK